MSPSRMEAFSDGVLAIIITIMVLGLQPPHEFTWHALHPLIPFFFTYILAFITLGNYWNNHHHLLRATKKVTGSILWLNLHLLFWLSLFPFVTSWLGESKLTKTPLILYSAVNLCAGTAYYFLQQNIIKSQGPDSWLKEAIGSDFKGKLSIAFYVFAIVGTVINHWISVFFITIVAVMWLIPDRRLESHPSMQRSD